ncbi:MAG: site-specific integrase [Patescibacteria group bacterium]|nr:site-specific integrase [Patescibacteria group bacterium]
MIIAELLAKFHAYNVRHKSDKTVRFYRSRLRLFAAKFGKRPVGKLTPLEIDEFLELAGRNADGQPLSSTTCRHNAVALTTLQSFALEHELIAKPWFRKLKKPRARRRERIPEPEEIAALLKHANPAFRLIYTALAQSGARPGELCAATIADVIRDERPRIELAKHKTAAKTGKPRIIPLGGHFLATVIAAIGDRQAGPIFLSEQGKGWNVNNLSSMHRKLRDAAGLPRDLVLYLARHRFATECLRAGVSLNDVSLLMGHADIKTTQIYLHRDATEAAAGQDKVPDLPKLPETGADTGKPGQYKIDGIIWREKPRDKDAA